MTNEALRAIIVLFFIVAANLTCALRLTSITLDSKEKKINHVHDVPYFVLDRADIIDTNGAILAVNLYTMSLYADPKLVIEPQITARKISEELGDKNSMNRIYSAITSTNKRFVWIKRHLPPRYYTKINNLGQPGIFFTREEKRVYPNGRLLSHLIGNVDTERHGISGAEKYFDAKLRSLQTVQLSIDVRVQNAVRQELGKQITKFTAKAGSAIVMDIKTGEVLALVSMPDYDPNNIKQAPNESLFNRGTLGVYEIGSVFKTFIAAMAIEDNVISLDEKIDVSMPIKVGKDHYTKDLIPIKGEADLETIFKKSSNIGMAKIGLRLGAPRIQHYLREWGFNSMTQIELPEKGTPLHPRKWSDAEVATISYGYGVAATMVHFTEAMGAVVNGGKLVKATLIKNDVIKEKRIISQRTSDIVRKLLYKAVKDGTGRSAFVSDMCVGGKTGTSDRLVNGKYDKNVTMASFAAVFPIYDPKYVITVMVEEPKDPNGRRVTGGLVAAPVAGNIIRRLSAFLDIETDQQRCALYE